MKKHATGHKRRGFVLIMVMAVLAGLALMALHLAARCRMRLAELSGTVRAAQGKWLAYGAMQRGLVVLAADTSKTDSWNNPWAQLGRTPTASWFTHDIDGLSKDLVPYCAVQDEHAKLNIRLSAGLTHVAQLADWGKQVAPLLADWTDSDDQPQAGGAESADYQETPGYGYAAKNKPLELLEEMRLLMGMSRQAFLGEDVNGNCFLDAGEDTNQDGTLNLGPWSLLTCAGDGTININTAPLEVLATLPLFDRDRAAAVIACRESREKPGAQDPPFKVVEDLRQAVPLADWELDVLRPAVCVASGDFRLVAIVYDAKGLTVARQEALVVRDQGTCKIRFFCAQ